MEPSGLYPGPKPGPGPPPSSASLRSDDSRGLPPDFTEPLPEDQSTCNMDPSGLDPGPKPRPGPPPSSESLRSDNSRGLPPDFTEPRPEDQGELDPQKQPEVMFTGVKQVVMSFVKEELDRLHMLLGSENPERIPENDEEQSSRQAVLSITLDFLKKMNLEHLAECLSSRTPVGVCRDKLKSRLQQKFSSVFEGVAKAGKSAPLQQIYTEVHITEGEASEVNQEHEVRHIENMSIKLAQAQTVSCEELFKNLMIRRELTENKTVRTVLMKGVAGIGKTVLTQKFSLDWAEGRANQDIQLLFPFAFRELNVLQDTCYSLMELLNHYFSETKGLCSFKDLQVLFIFDGLDECRIPLDFRKTRVLTEPSESASVEELLVNLIRGDLLPSALLWITTRPAAANQIPAECISMVTEIQGFTDLQKEEYFMKRFRDKQQAIIIISHIKSIHSLYIMCYIPVFCWILSTVLLHLMETRQTEELPKTLTQMYIYFLVVQAKIKNIKYHGGSGADLHWTEDTKEMVWSLGKLAFEQLMKGNLIFYEHDLRECGLDAAEIARYSGVFTEVFREEPGLYQFKVYCFIHFTIQEFMAALHAHQTFFTSGVNLLSPSLSDSPEAFYRSAVDLALQSPNGHLDMFVRFLLGFSLPANQELLSGLLTHTGRELTNQETVKYIKLMLNEEGLSAEGSMNLLHCLNELNDRSLVEGIQWHIREGHLSWLTSPSQWSALTFLLLSSNSDLKQFDLRKYQPLETVLHKLLPVVKASTKAILSGCGLTAEICSPLASVLSSSSLTNLDLSNNDLQDTGVELLCSGLKSASCRLETLRLSGCLISERGGASLASVLSSSPSALRELDLSYNNLGTSVNVLTALLAQPNCPLNSLRLEPFGEQWGAPGPRKYSCEFSLDPNTAQKNLLLSENKRTVTKVKEVQQYTDHEDRFIVQPQILSSVGLRGRCYWEVQWSGRRGIEIAVSYRGIGRKGWKEECRFGDNNQSWALRINNGDFYVCHRNRKIELLTPTSYCGSGVVGVFLDSEAGALSFYEIRSSGELFHLHTFLSSFTEPLFPGLKLRDFGSTASVVDRTEVFSGQDCKASSGEKGE